jgi:hypothetical protein
MIVQREKIPFSGRVVKRLRGGTPIGGRSDSVHFFLNATDVIILFLISARLWIYEDWTIVLFGVEVPFAAQKRHPSSTKRG